MKRPTGEQIALSSQLSQSVIRLANEADDTGVAISGVLNALLAIVVADGQTPCEMLWGIMTVIGELQGKNADHVLAHIAEYHSDIASQKHGKCS